MAKYIDADKIIDYANEEVTGVFCYPQGQRKLDEDAYREKWAFVRDIMIAAPAADVAPRWIPVTERLPDINDHYTSDVCLVYCDNGAYAFAELEENIFGQVGWDCEREDDYYEAVGTVVAWMPLPEPYKEGEQNG